MYTSRIQREAFVQKRSPDAIAADLHREMLRSGALHHNVFAQNIYVENEAGTKNARVWGSAKSLKEAKAQVECAESTARNLGRILTAVKTLKTVVEIAKPLGEVSSRSQALEICSDSLV